MHRTQSDGEFDIESKMKEADVYYSMGLFEESLGVYVELASIATETNPRSMNTIKRKIDLLKKKIADQEKIEPRDMTDKHVEIVKQELSSQGSSGEALYNASALKELGLMEEAIAQFEKLLASDSPTETIVPELAACLLKTLSPSKVISRIAEVIDNAKLDSNKRAEVKFFLGVEMEKEGHKDLAIDLLNEAAGMDPRNKAIDDKLNELMADLSSGSRYDYLLNMKIVTSEQLQKALAFSKKARKSVEFALIDQFKIKKEEVGKSLSLFYGCPFVSFDSKVDVPVELIRNLKKSFLLHDLWVPMNWSKKGVEILLDDPKDLRKTGQIRGLIKIQKVIFSVGIREDIIRFINFFFENITKQHEQVEAVVDELDFVQDIAFEEEEDDDDEEEIDEASGQVVRLVDQILVTAYRKEASDIHVEPSIVTKSTGIRLRMDGVCQEYLQLPNSMARGSSVSAQDNGGA